MIHRHPLPLLSRRTAATRNVFFLALPGFFLISPLSFLFPSSSSFFHLLGCLLLAHGEPKRPQATEGEGFGSPSPHRTNSPRSFPHMMHAAPFHHHRAVLARTAFCPAQLTDRNFDIRRWRLLNDLCKQFPRLHGVPFTTTTPTPASTDRLLFPFSVFPTPVRLRPARL